MTHRWRMFAFRTGTVLMFATAILLPASAAFADPVNPTPSTDGMPGAALWNQVLGWMMQWGLWLSLAGCAGGSSVTNSTSPTNEAVTATVIAADAPPPAVPASTSVVLAPSVEDASAVALQWVASTGDLLKMGPIARGELLRRQVASASAGTMTENLNSDLAKLADGLPIPASGLRLVETPLTIDISVDATGAARAHVWSIVVFGAKDLGAPRMSFRTSELVLIVEAGEWKLASFTTVEGPTPIATDSLPADWDSFAVVADWQPASGVED